MCQSFKLTPQEGLQHLQLPWRVLRPRPSWNRQDGHSKVLSADITAVKALTAIQQQHSLKLCWTEGKGKSTNIQGHVDRLESSEIQLRNGKGCLQLHAIPGFMRRMKGDQHVSLSPSLTGEQKRNEPEQNIWGNIVKVWSKQSCWSNN